ncbi:unnamed protein product, partial [Pylaiella littoralis]
MTTLSSGSRQRTKRGGRGDGGSPAESRDGELVDLDNSLSEFLQSHTDNAETKERKLKIKENEAKAAVIQAESFRDVAIGSPSSKKRKMNVDVMDAETRKLQADQKQQLANQRI